MKNPKTTSIFYFLDSRFSEDGFTLMEVVISLSVIIIMTTLVVVILDPARQFAKSRNTERWSDVNVILNAVGQNTFSNKGTFSCSSGGVPTTTTRMASSSPNYNIAPCLVSTYLNALPFDPATSGAKWASAADYDTAYNILRNATTGRVTISAPAAELGESITVTR